MRHLLPLTICSAIVLGGAILAVNAHRDTVHQSTVQSIRAEASKLKAEAQAKLAAHKQAEATDAKLAANQKGCKDGLAAYNLLTVTQRSHVVKPVCS